MRLLHAALIATSLVACSQPRQPDHEDARPGRVVDVDTGGNDGPIRDTHPVDAVHDDDTADADAPNTDAAHDGDASDTQGTEDADTEDTDTEDTDTEDTDTEDTDAQDEDADTDAEDADVEDTDDADADTDAVDSDADAEDADADTTPVLDGLCGAGPRTPRAAPGAGTRPGAPGPFGGEARNRVLGAIADTTVIPPLTAPGAVNLGVDLDTATYDVRVPPAYDGSRPFGVVVFINSSDDGGLPPAAFESTLDAAELLWVAPDDAGNARDVATRTGRAAAGLFRAMELWNVDPTRIYGMGKSGGARSVSMLGYQLPDTVRGTLAWCGANYPRPVAQDFETHEPDSHYEFWGAWFFPEGSAAFIDRYRATGNRTALITSFDDFRAGDLFNIYHNGFNVDDVPARLLMTSGGHCAVDGAQMADGVAWLSHPLFPLWAPDFAGDPLPEHGALFRGAARLDAAGVTLPGGDTSGVVLRRRVNWRDARGAVVEWRAAGGDGGEVHVGFRGYDAASYALDAPPVLAGEGDGPGFTVVSTHDGARWTRLEIYATSGGGGTQRVVAAANIDSAAGSDLSVRVHAWGSELQVTSSLPLSAASGATLLAEARTLRLRGFADAIGASSWPADDGSVFSVGGASAGDAPIVLDAIRVRDASARPCEALDAAP